MKIFIGSGLKFLETLQIGSTISNLEFIEKNKNQIQFFNPYQLFDHEVPTYFILYNDFEVIGVLKTQPSLLSNDTFPFKGINYCSVKEKYQGIGLARQLYTAMFQYYSNDFIVGTDYESADSKLKLKKMSYRLAKENNVYFMDRRKISSYESHDLLPTKSKLYQEIEYLD